VNIAKAVQFARGIC